MPMLVIAAQPARATSPGARAASNAGMSLNSITLVGLGRIHTADQDCRCAADDASCSVANVSSTVP